MGYKEAAEIVRVLDGLVREWAAKGELSALEQDLMLDKTKKLYETVRFATGNDGRKDVAAPLCEEPRATCPPAAEECVVTESSVREASAQTAEPVAAGCGTIADALASAMPHGEYACGDRVTSLNDALGLNDRYQICRDLFDGDMEACRSAIDKLDLYDNIEDAMICIQDNYRWPGDSSAAQLVASLLERKFL